MNNKLRGALELVKLDLDEDGKVSQRTYDAVSIALAAPVASSDFTLVADYDMGRRGDVSTLRITMPDLDFSDQLAVCRVILDALPVGEFRVDPTGVGAQLADDLMDQYGSERIKKTK